MPTGAATLPAGGAADVQSTVMSPKHQLPLQQWGIPVSTFYLYHLLLLISSKLGVPFQFTMERLLYWAFSA
jgi:hypothetical protein